MIWVFFLAAVLPPAACRPVAAQHIYARDLAALAPALAALPPDLDVGFAPVPGQRRTFHPAELRRLAAAHGIAADFTEDVCFAWAMAVPSKDAILEALGKTLAGRAAHIDFLEQSLASAPVGELVFPLSGISGVSDQPILWRGYVRYAGEQRFLIWARVRVQVREQHVVASETIKPDAVITPGELHLETYEGPVAREQPLSELASALGRVPRHPLAAGVTLYPSDLVPAREVERGDTVEVVAQQGQARIETQGLAEEAGRSGGTISVRNLRSGRRFRARIEDKDKVLVIPGTSSGLAVEENRL